ncbi:HPr(Ser) kinase/phosphatase [Akkermansiaceae bacterium]|nr:HPr(Ser) kinase/phosphatase [Akkermansiaceae bacterium]
MKTQKIKRILSLKVGEFMEKHGEELKMVSVNGELGYEREIYEPSVNRPGLALSGFIDYFACERVQVFGNSEFSFLEQCPPEERTRKFQSIIDVGFPCAVLARNGKIPDDVVEVASKNDVAVFQTELSTMSYMNSAMYLLEQEFAITTNLHGCMISYRGVGMLIMGSSGIGKSEAALGLVESGAALVADDKVKIKKTNGKLTATTEEFSRGFIEMRGVGIINVGNLYGLGAIRESCNVELIIFLRPEKDLNNVDRVGAVREEYDVLGVKVPYIEIPVAPGRDTARLISVAALDFQLRKVGYDMAQEFNQRILDKMSKKM